MFGGSGRRLLTRSNTRSNTTASPESDSGASGSRITAQSTPILDEENRSLDCSHASRAFEDVPFLPPPESNSPANRQNLPQSHDRDLQYEHPYLPRRVAESSHIPFEPNRFLISESPQRQSSRHPGSPHATSQGALLPGSPRRSAHVVSASQSRISPPNSPPRLSGNSPPRLRPIPDAGPALREQLGLDPSAPVSLRSLPDPLPGTKPTQSLPLLTKLAIYGSPRRMLTLQEIYAAIEERFEWFRLNSEDKAWKNSIRHNLSLNKVFRAIQRPITEPGKGSYWCVDLSEGEGYKRPRKRRNKERASRSHTDGEAEESSEGEYESSPVDESNVVDGTRYHQGHHVGEGRPRLGSRRSSPYHRSVSPSMVRADLSLHSGQGVSMNSSPILSPQTVSSFGLPHVNNVHNSTPQVQFDQAFPMSSYVQSSPLAQPSLGQAPFMSSGLRQQGQTQSSTSSFRPFPLSITAPSVGALMPSPTIFAPGHSTNLSLTANITTSSMHFMRGSPVVVPPAIGTDFRLAGSSSNAAYRGQDPYEMANRNDDFRTWSQDVFQPRNLAQYQTAPQGSQSSNTNSQHNTGQSGPQQ